MKLYYPHCQVLEREVLRGVAAGVGEELRGVALINTNHLPHSCPNDTKLAYVSVPHRIALPTHEDEATRRGPGGVVVPGYLHIYTYLHISTEAYLWCSRVCEGSQEPPVKVRQEVLVLEVGVL